MAVDPNAPNPVDIIPPPIKAPVPIAQPTTPAAVPTNAWDPQGVGMAATQRLAAQNATNYAPVQNLAIPAEGRALLSVIGSPNFESNGTYTQRFNQPDFADFSKHPETYGRIASGPNRGSKSNAAGRYQFLSTTWADQAKKLGLNDFSPANQDAAAWNLAKETYAKKFKGRDLATDLQNPNKLNQVADALRSQWTSLPGGIEGARSNFKKLSQSYAANLQREMARNGNAPAIAAPAGVTPAMPLGKPIMTSDNWARGAIPATTTVTAPPPAPGVQVAWRNPLYNSGQ